jgi:hypothetical protein
MTLSRLAVCLNRSIEREPPETLRRVLGKNLLTQKPPSAWLQPNAMNVLRDCYLVEPKDRQESTTIGLIDPVTI